MNPIDRSRRQGSQPTGYRGRLMLMAAALTALAGCESGYGARQGDPFVGIRAQPIPSPAAGTGTTASSTATAAVPPLPGSVTSPALGVVAGGTTLTPENPRADLRMPTAPIVPVSSPGAARGLAPSSAVLGEPVSTTPESSSSLRPVPSVPSGGFQQTGASAPGAAATSSGMTFEQAQQFLKKRGVAWQRLETLGDQGQWRFRCSIPVPNQKINHTYETVSPFPYDPLTAIRAVISQIEQGQH